MNILYLDIETAPNLQWSFRFFEGNALKVVIPGTVMMVGYQWEHERKVHSVAWWDNPKYKPGRDHNVANEKWVLAQMLPIIEEADHIIAHYGRGFDKPMLENRYAAQGFPPLPIGTWVDSKRLSAKLLKVPAVSQSLGNLCEYFGVGEKIETNLSLWFDCIDGDEKAQRDMVRYCKHDVRLLKKFYLKVLRPRLDSVPNMALDKKGEMACPSCGSTKLEKRGTRRTSVSEFQRYRCLNPECGRYSRARKRNPDSGPEQVPLR